MAKVYLTRLAEKQLTQVSAGEQAEIARKLFLLTEFPLAGVRLYDQWEGCRALYTDHHRIIYYLPKEDEAEVLYIRPGRMG